MAQRNTEKVKSFLQFKQNPTLGMFKTAESMKEFAEKAAQKAVDERIEEIKGNFEKEIQKLLKDIPSIRQQVSDELKKALQEHVGKDGLAQLKGDPGKDGITPQKGVDFFTDSEIRGIAEMAAEMAKPEKGVDFDDGKDADPEEVAHIILNNPEFRRTAKGKDGKSVDNKLVARFLASDKDFIRMLKPRDGKDADPDVSAEKAFQKLTEKKLPINFIENLPEELNAIRQAISMSSGGGGGGMGEPQHETFSGDGSTTEFTLSFPVAASGNAIWVYLNGQFLLKDTHYTVSDRTLDVSNLDTVPQSSETLDVTYIRGS